MTAPQRLSACFWFDRDAEAAADFYVSLLERSRVIQVHRYGPGAPLPEGTALMVSFELDGVQFLALNGGPHYTLSPAASIVVHCESQAEIDRLWEVLAADGGRADRCGRLTDRFGLSWQIVPSVLPELLRDAARAPQVMAALMQMGKLDIAALETAYRAN